MSLSSPHENHVTCAGGMCVQNERNPSLTLARGVCHLGCTDDPVRYLQTDVPADLETAPVSGFLRKLCDRDCSPLLHRTRRARQPWMPADPHLGCRSTSIIGTPQSRSLLCSHLSWLPDHPSCFIPVFLSLWIPSHAYPPLLSYCSHPEGLPSGWTPKWLGVRFSSCWIRPGNASWRPSAC